MTVPEISAVPTGAGCCCPVGETSRGGTTCAPAAPANIIDNRQAVARGRYRTVIVLLRRPLPQGRLLAMVSFTSSQKGRFPGHFSTARQSPGQARADFPGGHNGGHMKKWSVRLAPALVLALAQLSLTAQGPVQNGSWADEIIKKESYATPPPELADAVLAPRHLNVNLASISPDKAWFVDEIGDGPVLMKTFAKPFHELGGVFIDHKANRSRALTIRNNVGIQLISATDGTKKSIQLPAGARVSNATWSPDGKAVAFYVHGEDASHIWIADAATGVSRQVTKTPVLATLVSTFEFSKDGKQIAAVFVPDGRAAMPQPPAAP